jgi:transposase InsO family protein
MPSSWGDGGDGVQYRIFENEVMRIVVPNTLVKNVVAFSHGSKAVGLWVFLRTTVRVQLRYWWPGLKADLQNAVKSCRACHLRKHRLTRSQAKVIKWHPPARFHTVAMDMTEIFPASVRGHKKALVIGDHFTRFVIAIPIKDETASTIATILFERWISVFGPPVRLVSDQGKPLVSAVVRHLCERIGTNKIETSAYHPQTDGFVERYNRTLCEDIAKFVMNEENWDVLVPLATFRYNCSRNSATGVSPYSAMFGMDA